jgi:hypothetical protein
MIAALIAAVPMLAGLATIVWNIATMADAAKKTAAGQPDDAYSRL